MIQMSTSGRMKKFRLKEFPRLFPFLRYEHMKLSLGRDPLTFSHEKEEEKRKWPEEEEEEEEGVEGAITLDNRSFPLFST